MRLVILTGGGLEHRYVTDVLASSYGDALQAVIVAQPSMPLHRRVRSSVRRYSTRQLVSRFYAKAYAKLTRRGQRSAAEYERRFLPGGQPDECVWENLLHTVPTHSGQTCLTLLRRLAPDIIAVYGTGIITAPVMELARVAILNMHTGLSPRYRGSDTIFWPLHNEEPEWVGTTIHVLDEGVDSGPIISSGRPEIRGDDTEESLFCKAVIVGARLYVEAIGSVYAIGPWQEAQRLEEGRNYRFVDRTVTAERRVVRLLKGGLLRRYAEQTK